MNVPAALIAKYDRRVPRYTSYPTAPHFSPAVTAADYSAWLGTLEDDAALSLYLHVPFCAALCLFCGCHTSVVHRPGAAGKLRPDPADRNPARCGGDRPAAQGAAYPLGRRHAHSPAARADARRHAKPARAFRRSTQCRGRRRDRSARTVRCIAAHAGGDRDDARQPRCAGLRPARAAYRAPRAGLRTDRRMCRAAARGRYPARSTST